ncbi:hypothetical protein [Chromobacterium haemolyticum]|uniref:hypothetical protein n=1 Tax=Chromobacterium haemolyticum TaxID=394935 RepID=UPI0024479CEA|nr:hypothetical protein [Chromobacterium haemolyticum]MDH0340605.1 hypothetical protein [Chromobacterium haemolyticum]
METLTVSSTNVGFANNGKAYIELGVESEISKAEIGTTIIEEFELKSSRPGRGGKKIGPRVLGTITGRGEPFDIAKGDEDACMMVRTYIELAPK